MKKILIYSLLVVLLLSTLAFRLPGNSFEQSKFSTTERSLTLNFSTDNSTSDKTSYLWLRFLQPGGKGKSHCFISPSRSCGVF